MCLKIITTDENFSCELAQSLLELKNPFSIYYVLWQEVPQITHTLCKGPGFSSFEGHFFFFFLVVCGALIQRIMNNQSLLSCLPHSWRFWLQLQSHNFFPTIFYMLYFPACVHKAFRSTELVYWCYEDALVTSGQIWWTEAPMSVGSTKALRVSFRNVLGTVCLSSDK